jgi:hypothetical protein
MQTYNPSAECAAHVAPTDLPDLLPSRPVFSSYPGDLRDIVLQRYQHPPGRIEVPGLRDHLVVVHLIGPVLIEDEYDGGESFGSGVMLSRTEGVGMIMAAERSIEACWHRGGVPGGIGGGR